VIPYDSEVFNHPLGGAGFRSHPQYHGDIYGTLMDVNAVVLWSF
jgi:hypothetical protein